MVHTEMVVQEKTQTKTKPDSPCSDVAAAATAKLLEEGRSTEGVKAIGKCYTESNPAPTFWNFIHKVKDLDSGHHLKINYGFTDNSLEIKDFKIE